MSKLTAKELSQYADDYEANGIRQSNSQAKVIADTYRAFADALELNAEMAELLITTRAELSTLKPRLTEPYRGNVSALCGMIDALLAKINGDA